MPAIRDDILSLNPNAIGEVSRYGAGRKGLIPLWFGETDLVTPDFIREAAKAALDRGETFYSFAGGHPKLREAIRVWTQRWYGVTLGLDRIWVPGSAMLSIVCALQCCLRQDDEVLIIGPMWPNIGMAVEICHGRPVYVRLDHDAAAGKWKLDFAKLEAAITPRTRMIFCASPGNPTGWMMSADEQRKLLDLTRRRGLALLADEVYGVLTYDAARAPSFLEWITPEDDVFVINSFSKAWAMTGWRTGWMVAPARLAQALMQLSVNNNTGATVFAQFGAVAALEQGDAFIGEMRARCAQGRAITRDFVAAHNRVSWVEPEGAFYAYVHIDGMTQSIAFAKSLIDTVNVGVAPGAAFRCGPDDLRDESYLRLCFAQDPARLEEALTRIGGAIAQL